MIPKPLTFQVSYSQPGRFHVTLRQIAKAGAHPTAVRGWVLWHLIEHELQHGAEIAVMLREAGFAQVEVAGLPAAFFASVPGLRRLNTRTGPISRVLARSGPSLFAPGLAAVAHVEPD